MSDANATLQMRFSAAPAELKRVREAVRAQALTTGCDPDTAHDVMLAVDEACQNIIRHAYRGQRGEIALEMFTVGDRLTVRLIDDANPVDPGKIEPRPLDDLRPGGLGTHFIREIMDEMAFLPPPPGAGNLLQLVKRIGRSAMSLDINHVGAVAVLSLSGDIDLQHAPKVRKGLLDAVGERRDVVVDLARVSYIDSSGIACLVEAFQTARRNGTGFALAGVSPAALRVLELARLDKVFTIHPSVDTALGG